MKGNLHSSSISAFFIYGRTYGSSDFYGLKWISVCEANKKINYPVFLYNRGLRLLPLLLCVLLIIAAQAYMDGRLNAAFFIHLLKGFVLPTLPNGGWSITVEFHFYIILPVL